MGGAASLAHLPSDLMSETQLSSRNTHMVLPQTTLSKEVLHSLRRKSVSKDNRKRSFSSRRFSKSLFGQQGAPVHEIPPKVNALLEKMGIANESAGSEGSSSKQRGGNQDKTSKLVGHIFECLGALQHLVLHEQGEATSHMNMMEGDTESIMEQNTMSLGKLIHEMVTIYGLCGDTAKVLLDSNPETASCPDSFGRLPLHVAIDRPKPWLGIVEDLIEAYPEALNTKDGGGRVPLHVAVDRDDVNENIVRLLVQKQPLAAQMLRGVGRLPLHYAVFPEAPKLNVVNCLLDAHPSGAQVRDVYGRLPLHYAVDKTKLTDLSVVKALMKLYRHGAAVKDTQARLPMVIALERSSQNPSTVHVLKLLHDAYPEGISQTTGGALNRLPLHIAVDVAQPNVASIYYLAQKYPAGVMQMSTNGDKSCSPMSSALAKGAHEVVRVFLGMYPEYNPLLLRELNWKARRIAMLLFVRLHTFVNTKKNKRKIRKLNDLHRSSVAAAAQSQAQQLPAAMGMATISPRSRRSSNAGRRGSTSNNLSPRSVSGKRLAPILDVEKRPCMEPDQEESVRDNDDKQQESDEKDGGGEGKRGEEEMKRASSDEPAAEEGAAEDEIVRALSATAAVSPTSSNINVNSVNISLGLSLTKLVRRASNIEDDSCSEEDDIPSPENLLNDSRSFFCPIGGSVNRSTSIPGHLCNPPMHGILDSLTSSNSFTVRKEFFEQKLQQQIESSYGSSQNDDDEDEEDERQERLFYLTILRLLLLENLDIWRQIAVFL